MKNLLLIIFIFIVLAACNNSQNVFVYDDSFISDEQVEVLLQTKYELEQVILEQATQIQELNDYILEMESQLNKVDYAAFNNHIHQMFYGEWSATSTIFREPMPIRGLHLSEKEIAEDIANHAIQVGGEIIQFQQDYILINGYDRVDGISYNIFIIPADDTMRISGILLSLSDIGLAETEGNYFVRVEVRTNPPSLRFLGDQFFIKDINTIIVDDGDFFIVYERVSFGEPETHPRNWLYLSERHSSQSSN